MKTKFFSFVLALIALGMISCDKKGNATEPTTPTESLSTNKDIPALLENAVAKKTIAEVQAYFAENGYVSVRTEDQYSFFAPTGHTELVEALFKDTVVAGTIIAAGVFDKDDAKYDVKAGDYAFLAEVATTVKDEADNLIKSWEEWADKTELKENVDYMMHITQEKGYYVVGYGRASDKKFFDL